MLVGHSSHSGREAGIARGLLGALALLGPCVRFIKSTPFGWPWPAALSLAAVILACLLPFFFHSRRVTSARLDSTPFLLLPFSAAAIYRLAGGATDFYDPFHQGEYIHPARALAEGALPFADVFFVHGHGRLVSRGGFLDDEAQVLRRHLRADPISYTPDDKRALNEAVAVNSRRFGVSADR